MLKYCCMNKGTFVKNNPTGFLYERHRFVTGSMPKMHYHDYYEIYYLVSGERNHFVGDKIFTIKQGDFVAIKPELPHKTGGLSGVRVLICFNSEFLSRWLTHQAQKELLSFFDKTFIRPDADKQGNILYFINGIEKAYREKDEASIFSSLLGLLLILKQSKRAVGEDSSSTKILQSAMEYLQKNYSTIQSLDDVATALFISKYHLCHLFSKYVEVSFNNYLNSIRLKNASELLVKTEQTVSEIASNCGFSTATYFCQVFKREFGSSPLKYRKLRK